MSKGDLGAGQEPDTELVQNSSNKKWRSVNPEYERIREDNDGDGLSDLWESQNDRDPADGKLLFTFNCGGWQTEGWAAQTDLGRVTNIAGYQGYLDFDLLDGKATLVRDGLNLKVAKNQGELVIAIKANKNANIVVKANGKSIGRAKIEAGADYNEVRLSLAKRNWKGTINDLSIALRGRKGTTVGIDQISVK
jgi:hypothetical protein